MRTFIALELPGVLVADVAGVARQLSGSVEGRFMEPATYHLTLAFLGDIGTTDVAAAAGAIERACAGRAPVTLASDGLGKFGKPHDATLWLGFAPNDALVGLAAAVRDELEACDIAFDRKVFKPHVTLARRARIPHGDLPPLAFPAPCDASRVTLFKSELARDGATYKPLHTAELG